VLVIPIGCMVVYVYFELGTSGLRATDPHIAWSAWARVVSLASNESIKWSAMSTESADCSCSFKRALFSASKHGMYVGLKF